MKVDLVKTYMIFFLFYSYEKILTHLEKKYNHHWLGQPSNKHPYITSGIAVIKDGRTFRKMEAIFRDCFARKKCINKNKLSSLHKYFATY